MGASPRGSLALMLCARALAVIAGRDFVASRGRQGGRARRTRASDHGEAGALDDRGSPARGGRRPARRRPDARRPRGRRPDGAIASLSVARTGARRAGHVGRGRSGSCWRQSPSAGQTCSCSPHRSACRGPGSRARCPEGRSRRGCGSPTSGSTRARAHCGSSSRSTRRGGRAGDRDPRPAGVRRDPAGHRRPVRSPPREAGPPARVRRQPAPLGRAVHRNRTVVATSPGAATGGAPASGRGRGDRTSREPGLHGPGRRPPGGPDRPEQVAPRRPRVGVLRDPALPARRPPPSGQLAHHAAHGEVHSVGTSAEEDSSVLLLVDAISDVGASGGLDGQASTLDVGVRAASALAAHHIQVGDRVGLRVLGSTHQALGPVPGSDTSDGCRSCWRRSSPAGPTRSGPGGYGCASARAASWWSSGRCSRPRSPPRW